MLVYTKFGNLPARLRMTTPTTQSPNTPEPMYLVSESQMQQLELCHQDIATNGGENDAWCIMQEIRSRPAPSMEDANGGGWCGVSKGWLKERDAAIRKAERERIFSELWILPLCFGKHEAICDTRCPWGIRKRCIESLRCTPTPPGDERK